MLTLKNACIPALIALALFTAPSRAVAQGSIAGRVQEAIEVTDRRIEIADALVPDTGPSPAAGELSMAKQIQVRARSAFNAAQYGMAERSTLEARNHADRAIAIVRGLPDPDRVQMQVERTAELAERARERMADCTDNRARALLRVGLEMQARAEAAFRESRHLAALQLTMSARERIFKAMRLCNVVESLGDNAARAIQRTEQVLSRVRQALEDDAPADARRAFEQAVSLQSEAQAEYRAERYEAALRLTHTARLVAQRALRRSQSAGPGPGPRGRR